MKILLENWRKFVNEEGNKLWIVSGPPAVGKSTLLEDIKALGFPGLIVQDMDHIPAVEAATPDYQQLPPEQQNNKDPAVYRLSEPATPRITKGINDFIAQNAGKDMFLVGIAWLVPELPFAFPERAEKIYLYRDPADVIRDFVKRTPPEGPTHAKGEPSEAPADAIAGIEEEYEQYEARGWTRMSPSDIVAEVRDYYGMRKR